MDVKINSGELNRVARILSGYIDSRMMAFSSVEMCHEDGLLSFRAYSGVEHIRLSVPAMGGDGEKVKVDGKTLQKIAAVQRGEVHITSDGASVTFRGTGRTKTPALGTDMVVPDMIDGQRVNVRGEDLLRVIGKTEHAISTDESRMTITGELLEAENGQMLMMAMNIAQLSIEECPCGPGGTFKAVIPGAALRKIKNCISPSDMVTITADQKRVNIFAPGTEIVCGLILGEFPDRTRLIPTVFKTEVLIRTEAVKQAFRAAMEISGAPMVKIIFENHQMTVTGNSEAASFDETVDCDIRGDELMIAFDGRVAMSALNSIDDENITLRMNSPTSPAVIHTEDGNGTRLFLPVRAFI